MLFVKIINGVIINFCYNEFIIENYELSLFHCSLIMPNNSDSISIEFCSTCTCYKKVLSHKEKLIDNLRSLKFLERNERSHQRHVKGNFPRITS